MFPFTKLSALGPDSIGYQAWLRAEADARKALKDAGADVAANTVLPHGLNDIATVSPAAAQRGMLPGRSFVTHIIGLDARRCLLTLAERCGFSVVLVKHFGAVVPRSAALVDPDDHPSHPDPRSIGQPHGCDATWRVCLWEAQVVVGASVHYLARSRTGLPPRRVLLCLTFDALLRHMESVAAASDSAVRACVDDVGSEYVRVLAGIYFDDAGAAGCICHNVAIITGWL